MQGQYNLRSPAVKRLMKEAQELREPTEQYFAQPLDDNLFEWHFTIRGPEDSAFQLGIYHGRIVLPPDYPMKPPSIILLTPNGRFETLKKICLSISGHHPESWQPSWSIRTALLAIIGFMPTHGNGAIGSLDYTADERKVLARKSLDFKCKDCGDLRRVLKPVTAASEATKREAKELATQIAFQAEKPKTENSTTENMTPNIEQQQQQAQALPQMPNMGPFGQAMFAGQMAGFAGTFPMFAPPGASAYGAGMMPAGWQQGLVRGMVPPLPTQPPQVGANVEQGNDNDGDGTSTTAASQTTENLQTEDDKENGNANLENNARDNVEEQQEQSQPETAGLETSESDGLRHRHVQQQVPEPAIQAGDIMSDNEQQPQPRYQNAELRPSTIRSTSRDMCSLVLIFMLSLVLLMLILRRLYLSNAWLILDL